MAVLDESLIGVLDRIRDHARRVGFSRERGGIARGIAWAELSGRLPDNAGWVELRLHHDERDRALKAGLLIYRPLSRGGRTEVVGDVTEAYHLTPDEVSSAIVDACTIWLEALED